MRGIPIVTRPVLMEDVKVTAVREKMIITVRSLDSSGNALASTRVSFDTTSSRTCFST